MAETFQEGLIALATASRRGPDFDGLVVGWPTGADAASQTFFNALSDPRHQERVVLLLAQELASMAVAWLKQRQRSALLLWSDCAEIPDAMSKLLEPQRAAVQVNTLDEVAEHHLRVLLVDDSPTVRVAFRRLLMKYGFLVSTAENAMEGYRLALREPFDLAIVDYFMPGQNGTALVRKLRADPNTQHVVTAIITGTYSDMVINEALAAGASECIFKSESRELFLARIGSLARNIIDRKSIDRERRQLEGILHSVGDGVYGVDSEGTVQFINQAGRDILEYDVEAELIDASAYESFHNRFEDGEQMARESCFLSQCYRTGNQITGWQTTFWSRRGRPIPVECTVFPLEIGGRRHGSVVAFRDVSARKQLEEELRWQATHDSLTKLPNRSHFEQELEQELHRLKRIDSVSALLFVDLDRFKYINDTAGHQAGDRLLKEVAERLKERLRVSDSLARIGGDEYAVILRNVRADSIHSAADNFRRSLEELPFHNGGKQYSISATVGVALMDASTPSLTEVMANADIACHVAKNGGRNRVHLFSADADQKVAMDLELGWSARLRQALAEDLFELHYQPILDASHIDFEQVPEEEGSLWETNDPSLKGAVSSYEVFLRLRDSEGNLIAPEAFLPTAERFNMMIDIDRWVVNRAFARLAELSQAGRLVRFSINLSEQFLLDEDCLPFIEARLSEHVIDGNLVTFELSEARAISNLERTAEVVSALKELGCRIGLDDFGTGFASFTHLKRLDVDYLKIDGSYLRSMATDPINAAVLAAIAKIAHALGKETVAECVDSARIVRALQGSGIDQLQGYFIGRPQAAPTVSINRANVTSIGKRAG
ncbi:MAG: EAL domain-containing protein [Pseudomonadota bacterium]